MGCPSLASADAAVPALAFSPPRKGASIATASSTKRTVFATPATRAAAASKGIRVFSKELPLTPSSSIWTAPAAAFRVKIPPPSCNRRARSLPPLRIRLLPCARVWLAGEAASATAAEGAPSLCVASVPDGGAPPSVVAVHGGLAESRFRADSCEGGGRRDGGCAAAQGAAALLPPGSPQQQAQHVARKGKVTKRERAELKRAKRLQREQSRLERRRIAASRGLSGENGGTLPEGEGSPPDLDGTMQKLAHMTRSAAVMSQREGLVLTFGSMLHCTQAGRLRYGRLVSRFSAALCRAHTVHPSHASSQAPLRGAANALSCGTPPEPAAHEVASHRGQNSPSLTAASRCHYPQGPTNGALTSRALKQVYSSESNSERLITSSSLAWMPLLKHASPEYSSKQEARLIASRKKLNPLVRNAAMMPGEQQEQVEH
ncbi:otu-like cysteine protease domain-containing protein [Cyclospora cayetanensis]|uniref:Otu-like cysteine protease domain-containing protein n=1 Tax=Cyclospora cayetanensis TaxID=88456 RepID=A0A1D3CXQ8_9EIME|nr:otu-like cysteine protease domain-containing protein [Cyclospora cayetanensis]